MKERPPKTPQHSQKQSKPIKEQSKNSASSHKTIKSNEKLIQISKKG